MRKRRVCFLVSIGAACAVTAWKCIAARCKKDKESKDPENEEFWQTVETAGQPAAPAAGPIGTAEEPSPGPALPAEEPAAGPEPPVQEPAAGPEPPLQEPAARPEPPLQEPAARPEPPVQEPASVPEPPMQEPAAGPEPPLQEPAAGPNPPPQEPALGLQVPVQAPPDPGAALRNEDKLARPKKPFRLNPAAKVFATLASAPSNGSPHQMPPTASKAAQAEALPPHKILHGSKALREVLPGLYLGPRTDAVDATAMKEIGLTHLIKPYARRHKFAHGGLSTLLLTAAERDCEIKEPGMTIARCLDFIKVAEAAGGKILLLGTNALQHMLLAAVLVLRERITVAEAMHKLDLKLEGQSPKHFKALEAWAQGAAH